MKQKIPVTHSSGNVFADLGLPDAEILMVKARLTARIAIIIEERGLSQAQAAKLLGIDQPKISALLRGKLDGFSTERLFKYLVALGQEIRISVVAAQPSKRTKGKPARVSVVG